MFLARKVAPSKWRKRTGLSCGEIPADAVTLDLRTTENALSFWRCDDKKGVADVALAMAAAGDHLEGLDIALVPMGKMRRDRQTLDQTDGNTPVCDLVSNHINVSCIDYVRLGAIATSIEYSVTTDQMHRFTKGKIRGLLLKAVNDGRVDVNDLKGGVKESIKSELEKK